MCDADLLALNHMRYTFASGARFETAEWISTLQIYAVTPMKIVKNGSHTLYLLAVQSNQLFYTVLSIVEIQNCAALWNVSGFAHDLSQYMRMYRWPWQRDFYEHRVKKVL